MTEPNGVSLSQDKRHYHFNGISSSNSSRDSSPIPRVGHIPTSQLPPVRGIIPASQLPPARGSISEISQKVGLLSVASGQNVSNISSNKFNTSTPNQVAPRKSQFSENSSSVVPNSMKNVPLTDNTSADIANSNAFLNQGRTENSLPVGGGSAINSSEIQKLSQNQFPLSSSSQYFNQAGPLDTRLNGSQSQSTVGQNRLFTHNQNSLSQNIHSLQPNQFHSVSQVNKNVPQPASSLHQDLQSFSGSVQSQNFTSTPQQQFLQSQTNLGENKPSFTHSQGNLPPNQINQSQKLLNKLPSSQNLAFSQSQTNLPQNLSTTSSNLAPTSANFAPTSSSFPSTRPPILPQPTRNSPQSATQNFSSQSFRQYPNSSTQPHSGSHYLQNLLQHPLQSQNSTQALPPPIQFQTGLPPRVASYPQASTGPSTIPLNTTSLSQPQGPPQSQTFNPQINYNVGPSVTSGTSTNPSNFGVPPNLNGPSTLPPLSPQSQVKPGITTNRYPISQQQQPQSFPNQQSHYPQGGVVQTGFNRLWGTDHHDLLQLPNILPPTKIQAPQVNLAQEPLNKANCSPEVFRCTLTKIPESSSLLQKSRLPLGVLIHPFKDLSYLPVIQCNVIVRCRSCRTYINPFVFFVDSKRWKCNLCYRVNELPEEFQYDPVSKTYGDPSRRPEIKSSTIEYIAPAEYMLRPPQPAVYLFLIDVSRLALESGYLETLCGVLLEELKNLPGDARTQVGFLAYDSALHFFSLAEGLSQPHEMTVLDIDDVFIPTPDNLLVNLKDRIELVEDLLHLLPKRFSNTFDGNSALGAALQVAHKMMGATGGRVTVFQSSLPNIGPGALTSREDPNQRASAEVAHLNPVNDFYKRLALECSGQQVAVDLFIVNAQYVDMATISGISRFSGGCIHHFPLFKSTRPLLVDGLQKCLRRYLTRKIGFEAVMRVRCTRGLSIHTFHGNFFVRSTDLLSLPNINPDAAFGMQVAIEESLSDCQTVCFQAALLYTSSKGERRIRVHTLCLPIATTLHDVLHSADQQCIIGLLGKMAVDRSMQASLSDAREAFINVAIDVLSSYKFSLNLGSSTSGLLAPECLKLLPLYISAILKHPAFRIGMSTRLDDRVKAMIDMKTKPLYLLMQHIYPDMYPIHNLESQEVVLNAEEELVPLPPRLQLTSRCLENKGAFLMDCGDHMMILVGPNVPEEFLNDALGVTDYLSISDNMCEIPVLNNSANQRLHLFINYLNDEKPYAASIQIIRDNSPNRVIFLEKLVEDRMENALSYHEFLQHLKAQVK